MVKLQSPVQKKKKLDIDIVMGLLGAFFVWQGITVVYATIYYPPLDEAKELLVYPITGIWLPLLFIVLGSMVAGVALHRITLKKKKK